MKNYICNKYLEFIYKNKHIPIFFNVYNCLEIKDYSPSLTIGCGRPDKTGSVLFFSIKKEEK